MLGLHFIFPVFEVISVPWNLLGLLPLAVGVVIDYNADALFKRARTTVQPFRESSVLVTRGPFRISRNPMYLGFVLFLLGVAFLLGSLTPFGVIPMFISWIQIQFICVEEQMLAEQFGQDWLEYKAKVRRLV
jgi:protein-S-isoprenylcysteine O-methyltransferase Ste14